MRLSGILALAFLLAAGSIATAAAELGASALPVEGRPLAILGGVHREPARFSALEIHARDVRIHVGIVPYVTGGGERGLVVKPGPEIQSGEYRNESYDFEEVVITFAGSTQEGYVGIHPDATAWGRLTPTHPVALVPRNETQIVYYGSTIDSPTTPTRDRYNYAHEVDGPHLYAAAPGAFDYGGPLTFQAYGVDLIARGDGQRVLLRSGSLDEDGPFPLQGERRWIYLEAAYATIHAEAPFSWQVALANATVGDLAIASDGTYWFAPAAAGAAEAAARPVFLPLIVGLTLACSAAGGALVIARRRVRSAVEDELEAWDADECIRRANMHLEADRHERALEWTERAVELAPTSASVQSTRAFLLERMGRIPEAMAAYTEASRLDPADGEHDLHAARLALRTSREVAADHLERALARSPALVADVAEDPTFAHILAEPRLSALVEAAWERHAQALSEPEA